MTANTGKQRQVFQPLPLSQKKQLCPSTVRVLFDNNTGFLLTYQLPPLLDFRKLRCPFFAADFQFSLVDAWLAFPFMVTVQFLTCCLLQLIRNT